MKVTWLIGIALVALGCGPKPMPTIFVDPPAAMPKFKLIQSFNGQLVQVGEDGSILVQKDATNAIYATAPFPTTFQFDRSGRVELVKHSHVDRVRANVFLDDKGNQNEYLKAQPMVLPGLGQRIVGQPLGVPSAFFRYYSADQGVYATNRTSGVTRQVCDKPVDEGVFGANETMVARLANTPDKSVLVKFTPRSPPEQIYMGPPCDVFSLGPGGEVALRFGGSFGILESKNVVDDLPHSSFCLSYYKAREATFPVGFAWQEERGVRRHYPVMWTRQGQPVKLERLCPELESAVHIDHLVTPKIYGNQHGLLAIELSGSIDDPDSPGDVGKQTYERKVYVLQEVR